MPSRIPWVTFLMSQSTVRKKSLPLMFTLKGYVIWLFWDDMALKVLTERLDDVDSFCGRHSVAEGTIYAVKIQTPHIRGCSIRVTAHFLLFRSNLEILAFTVFGETFAYVTLNKRNDFFHIYLAILIVTPHPHGWCILGVFVVVVVAAGIHPSRTRMSGSFECPCNGMRVCTD